MFYKFHPCPVSSGLTQHGRMTPVATATTAKVFMAFIRSAVGLEVIDGSALSRLVPNSSLAHWKSCDEDTAGSKPEPSTNTSHLSLKMFHSSGVIPVSIRGLSSLGPVAGDFAVCCGV